MKTWQTFILGFLVGLVLSASGILVFQKLKNQPLLHVQSTLPAIENQNESADPDLLNINTATLDQLDSLPGIGQEKAQSILDFRNKYGNFRSKEDLLYVPGIGESLFEQIKDKIFVE